MWGLTEVMDGVTGFFSCGLKNFNNKAIQGQTAAVGVHVQLYFYSMYLLFVSTHLNFYLSTNTVHWLCDINPLQKDFCQIFLTELIDVTTLT